MDVNDIDISRQMQGIGEGINGALELIDHENMMHMDIHTIKNYKGTSGKKSQLAFPKSEVADYNTENNRGGIELMNNHKESESNISN